MSVETSNPAPPPPVRLSILHLFFVLTAAAICLAVNRQLLKPSEDTSSLAMLISLLAVFVSVVGGISLASLGLLLQYGFRRPASFPYHPGHWLLVGYGLRILGELVFFLVRAPLTKRQETLWYDFATQHVIATSLMMIALLVGSFCVSPRIWQITFWLVTLLLGVTVAGWLILLFNEDVIDWFWGVYQWVRWEPVVVGTWLLAVSMWDLRYTRRDLLHYVAIGCAVLIALKDLAIFFYTWLVPL